METFFAYGEKLCAKNIMNECNALNEWINYIEWMNVLQWMNEYATLNKLMNVLYHIECKKVQNWMNEYIFFSIVRSFLLYTVASYFGHWMQLLCKHSFFLFFFCCSLLYSDMNVFVLWIVWYFVQFSSVSLVIDCLHSKSCWIFSIERALSRELWLRSENIYL